MTHGDRIKRTLARQILHHDDVIDGLRQRELHTPADYTAVGRDLEVRLAILEEAMNLWTAFGFGAAPDRLTVTKAADR